MAWTRWVVMALPVLVAVATGCGDNGGPCVTGETGSCSCPDGPDGSRVCGSDGSFGACECSPTPDEGDWVEVFLTTLPDEGAGDEATLLLLSASGEVLDSARTPVRPLAVLGGETTETPFDVVIHVPDDPSWDASQPPGAGAYAVFRGVEDTPSQIVVYRWTTASSLEEIGEDGAAHVGAEPERQSLSGTITGPDSTPLVGAFVQVVGQGWDYTDDSGEFTVDELFEGPATVTIIGSGYSDSATVDVGDGGSTLTYQVAEIGPEPGPITHEGTVLDRESGDPVEGVEVRRDGDLVATTDAVGYYTFEYPVGTIGVRFDKDGYSHYWQTFRCVPSGCEANVELLPLEDRFLDTWSYCHSSDRGSSENYVYDVPGVRDVIHLDQVFRNDGTSDRTGIAGLGWHAFQSSVNSDSFFVGTPIPHMTSTQWKIYFIFGGYRFDPGYLAMRSLISRTEHFYRASDSDAECLFAGPDIPDPPGGPTCEDDGYAEYTRFEGDAVRDVISLFAGSTEVYCTAATMLTATRCGECGGDPCRDGYCIADVCGTGMWGIESCPTRAEIRARTATGPTETLVIDGHTISVGDQSFVADLPTPPEPPDLTPPFANVQCRDRDDGGYQLSEQYLLLGDSARGIRIYLVNGSRIVEPDGSLRTGITIEFDRPDWLSAAPGGIIQLNCETLPPG